MAEWIEDQGVFAGPYCGGRDVVSLADNGERCDVDDLEYDDV